MVSDERQKSGAYWSLLEPIGEPMTENTGCIKTKSHLYISSCNVNCKDFTKTNSPPERPRSDLSMCLREALP